MASHVFSVPDNSCTHTKGCKEYPHSLIQAWNAQSYSRIPADEENRICSQYQMELKKLGDEKEAKNVVQDMLNEYEIDQQFEEEDELDEVSEWWIPEIDYKPEKK